MTKIVINIDMDELKSGINQIADSGLPEEEFTCPAATDDPELNAENRERAIQEYSYGPSEKNLKKNRRICGTCKYYNMRSDMMECIKDGTDMEGSGETGYCENLDFTCAAENVCSEWGKGGPVTDFGDINTLEPIKGNEKDIF